MGANARKNARMKRYFRNLFMALLGSDPFRRELDEVTGKYRKTAERVCQLNEAYYRVLDRLAEIDKTEAGYQALIENLRRRIAEKDLLLERTKQDYQKRIEAYVSEIDGLRNRCDGPASVPGDGEE